MLRLNYPDAYPGVVIYTITRTADIQSRGKSMGATSVVERKRAWRPCSRPFGETLEQKRGGESGSFVADAI